MPITAIGEKNPASAGEEENIMNTPTETPNTTPTRSRRPGFWLRAIEYRKHALAHEYRKGLGATARAGISDEDYATTMATLEAMARNLGWTEDDDADFGPRGGRRGFGPGFGPAFGPGFGPGFGPHRGHRGHGHGRSKAAKNGAADSTAENSPEASRSTEPQA